MPVKKLKTFLDSLHVKYVSMLHSPAFTAQEIAAAAHVSGKQLAKTVVVKAGDKLVMIVLSANEHVNFSKLKEELGVTVDLASESEFKNQFPECEVGAMPPFGNLYDITVYVSDKLSQQKEIIFNAGSHSEVIQMSFADYEKCAKPKMISI